MEPTTIPDKPYFKIGEVSRLIGVESYVLRFWETEFSAIRPLRAHSNQRLYRHKDVQLFLTIKELLYEKKYTIAGARKFLSSVAVAPEPLSGEKSRETMTKEQIRKMETLRKEIREDLVTLKKLLNQK